MGFRERLYRLKEQGKRIYLITARHDYDSGDSFEFEGDKKKIRHIFYRCSVARPATESATTEDTKEVKTETLKLSATALDNNLVKSKSCEKTDAETYNNWYNAVYMPSFTTE